MEFFVERLGALGDGIVNTRDSTLFIPNALPGETVRINKIKRERTGLRAVISEVVQSSPNRVIPPCKHFNECGGCVAQHMGVDFYQKWKLSLVNNVLNGRIFFPNSSSLLSVDKSTRRRLRMAFVRLKGEVILGFRKARSKKIVDITHCPIATNGINSFITKLRCFLFQGPKSGEITITEGSNGFDVLISAAQEPTHELRKLAADFCCSTNVIRLAWRIQGQEPELFLLVDKPQIFFGPAKVEFPVNCFLQPTEQGESFLREFSYQAICDAASIIDLYAGCGTFSIPLAMAGKRVHSVEINPEQVEVIQVNAQNLKLTAQVRDLRRQPISQTQLDNFDVAIINPPRAGAVEQIKKLSQSKLKHILYISCNPKSFVRDAEILINGNFQLCAMQAIDQFLWSFHIEIAALFIQEKSNDLSPML
tara:strand:+ start:833 stop:2095 length:1263 start_codon:yes stop_codon:yes gene_type:complete